MMIVSSIILAALVGQERLGDVLVSPFHNSSYFEKDIDRVIKENLQPYADMGKRLDVESSQERLEAYREWSKFEGSLIMGSRWHTSKASHETIHEVARTFDFRVANPTDTGFDLVFHSPDAPDLPLSKSFNWLKHNDVFLKVRDMKWDPLRGVFVGKGKARAYMRNQALHERCPVTEADATVTLYVDQLLPGRLKAMKVRTREVFYAAGECRRVRVDGKHDHINVLFSDVTRAEAAAIAKGFKEEVKDLAARYPRKDLQRLGIELDRESRRFKVVIADPNLRGGEKKTEVDPLPFLALLTHLSQSAGEFEKFYSGDPKAAFAEVDEDDETFMQLIGMLLHQPAIEAQVAELIDQLAALDSE